METVVPVPGSSPAAPAPPRALAAAPAAATAARATAPATPSRPRTALRRWADAGLGAGPGEAPDDVLDHVAAVLLCPARLLPVAPPATA